MIKIIGGRMNLYRILKNGILSRKDKSGEIVESRIEEPVVSLKKEEPFSSSSIVSCAKGDYLDTEDELTLQKYQSNLRILSQRVKEEGEIRDFRLIREDDFFPYDWKWRVNCRKTYREAKSSKLSYALRMEEVERRARLLHPEREKFPIKVPLTDKEEKAISSSIPPSYGQVLEPTVFRSTKHFTINTPLAYTGSYNQVSSDRNFVVIDHVDSFCQSGYGYSADYFDAYLDMTHEELPISSSGIVLIPDEKYSQIMKDPILAEQLGERRVIRYRGEEATAINMVLSQEGILPYRAGKYLEYDPELDEIMKRSMQKFCVQHDLDYAHGHGNLFGRGGHFSDALDSFNLEHKEFVAEFCSYLQQHYPEYAGVFTDTFYSFPEKIVPAIGGEKIVSCISSYNDWAEKQVSKDRREYDLERDQIDLETHQLFTKTLRVIRNRYEREDSFVENDPELLSSLLTFFHSLSVEEQKKSAQKILELTHQKESFSK